MAALACDIYEWRLARREKGPLHVVVPSGTGTTALFLARHAPSGVRVLAVPCVGDESNLRSQMSRLALASGGAGMEDGCASSLEVLLPPEAVPFGTPTPRLLKVWREAAASGVVLDLVYGPIAWDAMLNSEAVAQGADVLYVNCGGHEGLYSQLCRYRRKGLLCDGEDPQLLLHEVLTSAKSRGRHASPHASPHASRPNDDQV